MALPQHHVHNPAAGSMNASNLNPECGGVACASILQTSETSLSDLQSHHALAEAALCFAWAAQRVSQEDVRNWHLDKTSPVLLMSTVCTYAFSVLQCPGSWQTTLQVVLTGLVRPGPWLCKEHPGTSEHLIYFSVQCFIGNSATTRGLTGLEPQGDAQLVRQATTTTDYAAGICGIGNGGALCISLTLHSPIQACPLHPELPHQNSACCSLW